MAIKRAEIDHGAHADKDQQGEQLGRNAGVVNHLHEPARSRIRHAQVGQDAAKTNRHQQGRFVLFDDGQVKQDTAYQDHYPITPGKSSNA